VGEYAGNRVHVRLGTSRQYRAIPLARCAASGSQDLSLQRRDFTLVPIQRLDPDRMMVMLATLLRRISRYCYNSLGAAI
jgi:hypothetical protein